MAAFYIWFFLQSLSLRLSIFKHVLSILCAFLDHIFALIFVWTLFASHLSSIYYSIGPWIFVPIIFVVYLNTLYFRMETLKRHLPISVPEGLNELQKIAFRFEDKIYSAAANQVDPVILFIYIAIMSWLVLACFHFVRLMLNFCFNIIHVLRKWTL